MGFKKFLSETAKDKWMKANNPRENEDIAYVLDRIWSGVKTVRVPKPAAKWADKNIKLLDDNQSFMFESKSDYIIYHSTYTSAIQSAEEFAIKNGYEIDKEEMADKVGLGPAKPKEGKTVKHTITLSKNGKEQKKALQIQVYNRGTSSNEYELNTYIA